MSAKRVVLQHILVCAFLLNAAHADTRCYTCVNARSNEECNRNGEIKVCAESEQSCQNEVRLNYPNGFGYLISKRCKQSLACENVQNQNSRPAWLPTQCNMDFKKNSVCQCCCTGDLCNEEELPCADVKRCPRREKPENGEVACTNFNFLGSKCEYLCRSGYVVGGPKTIECITKGTTLEWSDEGLVCAATVCRGAMQPPVHGIMSCSNNFAVGSVCSFRCSSGYKVDGPSSIICNANGEWAHQPPECVQVRCDDNGQAPDHGHVQCSANDQYESICEYACDNGYSLNGQAISVCQIDGTWSSPTPSCERVTCDPLPSDFSNGVRVCTDDGFYGSTCSYSCNQGYQLRGAISTNCLEDTKWSRAEPTCESVHCSSSPKIPNNGDILCSNGNEFASICQFLCKDGYILVGSPTTSCQQNGWSHNTPECKKIACNQFHDFILNGEVECTDGKEYASECKFQCSDGFRIIGPEVITCGVNSQWSNAAPRCDARACGDELQISPNTKLECSDGHNSFSRCQYVCGDGSENWESAGEMVSVCQRNGLGGTFEWSSTEPPCCARRCPPFSKVDLYVVLDSSSSVGQENWNKTLHFVADILDDFAISPDDLQVGLIRYNRIVDEESEIDIGQYTNKETTINAILSMPYNGQGTNTGNAISYVVTQMMTRSGNRPDVEDIVLLITDGRSRDDVKEPSIKLRETGADVIALGISNRQGSLTKEDLLDITDNPDNTIVSTTGFNGISTDLIQAFIAQICQNPCERQKQYSIDEERD